MHRKEKETGEMGGREREREREREERGGGGGRERWSQLLTSQGLVMQHDSIHSEETQRLFNVVSPGSGRGRIMVDAMQLHMSCV